MKPVDVNPKDLEVVRRLLREHVPAIEVRAFGSRVNWSARETSDLDLVLMTATPLHASRMVDLKDAFTESDLPFKVDLVDWATTKDRFRRIIEREYVVVQEERKQSEGTGGEWTPTVLGDV